MYQHFYCSYENIIFELEITNILTANLNITAWNMPTNKNAIARLRIIDKMLNEQFHCYSIKDITKKVNEDLSEVDPDAGEVTQRTVEKDIRFIEDQFNVDIKRYTIPDVNPDTGKDYNKRCLKYTNPDSSIFHEKLSEDEKTLLKEAISFIGQFDGLPKFETLEKLRQSLELKEENHIISFSKNPLEGKNLLGELYQDISEKRAVQIAYRPYTIKEELVTYIISPHLLKEYNRRWYLIGTEDKSKVIYNLSLDHIISIKPLIGHKYIEYNGDINERFEEIVGVTFYPDEEPVDITFWVSDKSSPYVLTKPIHESQKNVVFDDDINALRKKYPMLKGGQFFIINCRYNYELIRELTSFGKELVVLSPKKIQNAVRKWVTESYDAYKNIK